jgi:hypothetical protein
MRAPRPRMRYVFWLNLANPLELYIAEILEYSRKNRQLTTIIRDGVRLIYDLRQGKTDVLLEMFPWVKTALTEAEKPATTAIQHQLDRLEQLILQQGSVPIEMPKHSDKNGGPKALNVPDFDLPIIEDHEDDTVVLKKDTSTESAMNFINSMLNLQQ